MTSPSFEKTVRPWMYLPLIVDLSAARVMAYPFSLPRWSPF